MVMFLLLLMLLQLVGVVMKLFLVKLHLVVRPHRLFTHRRTQNGLDSLCEAAVNKISVAPVET